MSVYFILEVQFPNDHRAQRFRRDCLAPEDYQNERSGSTVTVHVRSHGDRFVVTENAARYGGTILKDEEIEDDN